MVKLKSVNFNFGETFYFLREGVIRKYIAVQTTPKGMNLICIESGKRIFRTTQNFKSCGNGCGKIAVVWDCGERLEEARDGGFMIELKNLELFIKFFYPNTNVPTWWCKQTEELLKQMSKRGDQDGL